MDARFARDSARVGQYTGWWRTENKEFIPSPGFRFGFTEHDDGGDFLLCDLKKDRLTSIKAAGDALGWWDDHNVLMRDAASDLVLFDVVTGKTNTLFSVNTIAQSPPGVGLTNDAARLTFFPNWNGHDYDFYFTVGPVDWLKNAKSFLIKADHAGPSLRLLYRNYSTLPVRRSGRRATIASTCAFNPQPTPAKESSCGICATVPRFPLISPVLEATPFRIFTAKASSFAATTNSGSPISTAATTSA